MLLAFDIGNSTIVAGVFHNGQLQAKVSFPSTVQRTPDETWSLVGDFLSTHNIPALQIDCAGISSVVPFHTSLFAQLCREKLACEPLTITGTLELGIHIHYENPGQLGSDRVCAAVAGYHKFGGPLILIDFGTSTTYGAVAQNGDFLGGAISLGVRAMADTLHSRTAQLPQIDLRLPAKVICTDTTSAIQAGTVFTAIDAVAGIVQRMKRELGTDTKVVVTGGLSELMAEQIPGIHPREPDLVLEGIDLICGRM